MYRQILVHPDDRDLQRIIWRPTADAELQEYQLQTVTYGLTCAPFLAIRTIRQLAKDEGERFPRAAAALRQDAYVDDILTGTDTLDEAQALRDELIGLCTAGGFPLSKWSANANAILKDIPEERRQVRDLREWESDKGHSALGLRWHPRQDCFAFRVQQLSSQRVTKRVVLSQVARLFDPMGWLSPVIIKAKILIQTMWLQHLDWDQPVPPTEERTWRTFRDELPALESVHVPRWTQCKGSNSDLEVHGFADASERAYAAVVYLRTRGVEGERRVFLLQAKTKVAPAQPVSLPRLELCAAALLAKLTAHVVKVMDIASAPLHLWSDSTVTLAWIQSHPSRWKTYVANRVADIQRRLPNAQWHHVSGAENPADCASRGLSPSDLPDHGLWWSGPPWLSGDATLPASTPLPMGDPQEERRQVHLAAVQSAEECPMLRRFSVLQRLLRVTAWCCRWLGERRVPYTPMSALSPQELEAARLRWIRHVQSWEFAEERRALSRGVAVPRRSVLARLDPFVDRNGVIRVGGRLKHAVLNPDERHPIILPRRSHFAVLVIRECHRRAMHGGVQLTLGMVRQGYWIPGGRLEVRRHIHRCVTCLRWRAASPNPMMGQLPPPRVTASRPFSQAGVDYAGPVQVRTAAGRGHKAHKAFLAIFVCFATRAVHIELVSSYATDAFLAAFRRFVSRRGMCRTLYSDRGTNFVGADAQLRAMFQEAVRESPRIADILASEGVEWRFNPPAAPHFGGLWEAAVKSIKHHLRRVIGESTLTFEELSTVLAQIEACLNSRPLQAISDDPEDVSALTPGHFLIGAALTSLPEPSLTSEPLNRLTRWQLLQRMRDDFWSRWSKEYLQSLTSRVKWWRKNINPTVGDLCLIRGENFPPSRWPLARITEVHPGADGQVRVVSLRTATTTLARPVVKVILLPRADTEPEDQPADE
ncbi:uncharacterized protein LOC114944167 [Nylanderia fulva]|nr:uncharacterized protein LOC114944167 [Nylanderia fulva]